MAKAAAGGDKIIDGAQAVDRCFRRVASYQLDDRRIAPAVGLPRRSRSWLASIAPILGALTGLVGALIGLLAFLRQHPT
jgi:hypothetical protein